MNNYHHDIADVSAPVRMHAALSSRQQQVLALLVNGYSNKEIADDLGLRFYTVSTHIKNIYRKLGVRKRTDAVVAALNGGYLKAIENQVPGLRRALSRYGTDGRLQANIS